MATETFPTLSRKPGYPIEEQYSEINYITSLTDAGYVHGRRRYTKNRKIFNVVYPGLSSADKDTLQTFVALVGTAIDFDWTNPDPDDGTGYEVRFLRIPTFSKIAPNIWRVSFQLLTI